MVIMEVNLKNKYSIKRTVFLTFGSFTVVMFLFYVCLSIAIAFAVEDKVINQLLVTESYYLRTEYNKAMQSKTYNHLLLEHIVPRMTYMKLYSSLEDMPREISKAIVFKKGDKEIFSDTQEHFHYRNIKLSDGKILYLVAEVSPFLVVSNMSGDIILLACSILLIMLTISLWFTYIISQRTISPIIKLSDAVQLNTNANLNSDTTPLPYLASQDEIGYLARSLASSYAQLSSALKREADFTRDVGHELRTPLTIISNTLPLNKKHILSDCDLHEIQKQTQEIKNIINVLMSLARAESIDSISINLRSHVEECVLLMHSKLEHQGFSVILEIEDDVVIDANQQLLSLLVSNLLENSLRYATSPQIKISAKDSRIVFENIVDSPINHQVLKRAVRQANSVGVGQGLYLVQRIAETMGWQCLIENETDEKTLFKLILITEINH